MKKLATLLTTALLSGLLANAIGNIPTSSGIPVVADANTVILDHFDGSNNAESVGTIPYAPGNSGLGQSIDLSTDGNYLIYSKSVNMENAGSVEMWLYPKSYGKSILNINWNYIKSYPPAGHVFHMSLDSTGLINFGNWGYTISNGFKANTKIPLNAWTHIAITWGDSTKLYLNGKLDMTSALLCRPAIRTQAYFYLPYWGSGIGNVDELHVSKVKRSAAEIASRIYQENPNLIHQVSPGNLSNVLTTFEKANLSTLRLSGTIDARDFRLMRDSMPNLENLDLSLVSIAGYLGSEGPRFGITDLYPANTIPRNAFVLTNGNNKLKTVVQPSNLTGIGRSAYNRCYNLTDINWPEGIKTIGYAAFNDCQNLTEANLPNALTVIDTFVFRNCIRLTSIVIKSAVQEIRYGAFLDCHELTSPLFEPNSQLTHIGFYAFGVCPKITSFVLPPKVNFIGSVAFLGTSTEVIVPAGHNYFTNINGVLYDKALTWLLYCPAMKTGLVDIPQTVRVIAVDAFYNCSGLDSITMPASLQIIQDWAFENCTGLRTLSIPASVTDIWSYAFYNCSGLKALYVLTPAPINLSLSDSVFNYIDKNTCKLYVLSGLKTLFQTADKWKDFANIIEVSDALQVTPGNLHTLWNKEIRSNLKRLNLTGSIDARDFKTMRDSMPLLEYIDLKEVSVVAYTGTEGPWNSTEYAYQANKIPEGSFMTPNSNYNLKTIILPDNLGIIGRSSFNRCYNLSTVKVGPAVQTIERYAFVYCTSLKSITLPNSLRTLLYGAFAESGLTSVTLPEGVRIIGEYTFQSCPDLETIALPATVEYIGYCAITFDERLRSIDVAGSNQHYSSLEGVLYDKSQKILVSFPNLKSNYYQVPEGVEVIDTAAFEGCTAFRTITLPSTLKRICLEAFYNCYNLASVEIPTAVTQLEDYAFYNCNNMKSISARQSLPIDLTNAPNIFGGVQTNECILRVPSGSKFNYQAATIWNTFANLAEDFSKTVNNTAGNLYNLLSSIERSAMTHLKITGTLDARDFKTMREELPLLAEVDISGASIVAYTGTEGTRSYSMSYKANAIPADAFFFRDREGNLSKKWLTKFVFPSSLTEIGDASFTNCGLRSINIHEGITKIEPWAFYGNRLNAVYLPSTLTTLGENCFGSNPDLTTYTVSTGNNNFMERNGLLYNKAGTTLLFYPNAKSSSALIPNGTVTIQARAFEGCDYVTFINISSEVQNIVAPAFSWASSLKLFQVESGNAYFASLNGVLVDKDQKRLVAYPNYKGNYYDIPYGIEEIGPSAFQGCWNLNEVNIPVSVYKIAKNAFNNCGNLNSINIPYSINAIEQEAFSECYGLSKITVNRGNPIDLNNSADVFRGVDKSTCVLKIPQNSYWNYKYANQWSAFNLIDEARQMTYLVYVPAGTKACYIAGEMNGWTQQPMTKEFDNFYRIELLAHQTDQYKYFSGPDWSYEELDLSGNVIDNRNFQNMDTVLRWRNVYQPWMPYSPWKINQNNNYSIGKIQFVSLNEGWIASGNDNGLLHTTDGGETWNKVAPFPNDKTFNMSDPALSMDWVDATHGWALKTYMSSKEKMNGAVIYQTNDAGATWNKLALPNSGVSISHSQADLQGIWQIHELMDANYLNVSPLVSAWNHAGLSIDGSGNCTFSNYVSSIGSSGPTSTMKMYLSTDGVLTMDDSELQGFLSSDNKTGFYNRVDKNGEHVFGIMQRQIPGITYSASDLTGKWKMHSLHVDNQQTTEGDYSYWVNGSIQIDLAGNATINYQHSHGSVGTSNAKFSTSADGFISVDGLIWHGFMSANKKEIYATMTSNDASKDFGLYILQKESDAVTYAQADLEGAWILQGINATRSSATNKEGSNIIASVIVRNDSTCYVSMLNSDDEPFESKLRINEQGVVTLDDDNFMGQLNPEKNLIQFTNADPTGFSMGAMLRDSSYTGEVGLQVQFTDTDNGIASVYNWLTNDTKYFRTQNGGTSWNPVSNNGLTLIFDFVDANNGWAISMPVSQTSNVGSSILRTTDGGLNWVKQYTVTALDNDQFLNAIQFTDLNHGWVTGEMGILLKTDDGGEHWTSVTNSGRTPDSNSKALFFLDTNTGWVTSDQKNGEGMVVLHTTDGGANWTSQNTNLTDGSLFSLFFWDENHGWFTGETKDEYSTDEDYVGIIGQLNNGPVKLYKPVTTNNLVLYPNPVMDGFYIGPLENGAVVSILQLNGAVVLKQRMEGNGYFDVRDLKKGMYIVRINSTKGVINKKIIKM